MILSVMVVMSVTLFASCGNSKQDSSSDSQNVESAAEGTPLEETVEPSDSIEVVTRGGGDSEGFGRCSKCSCNAFEGRGDVCKNCGHAYKAHY